MRKIINAVPITVELPSLEVITPEQREFLLRQCLCEEQDHLCFSLTKGEYVDLQDADSDAYVYVAPNGDATIPLWADNTASALYHHITGNHIGYRSTWPISYREGEYMNIRQKIIDAVLFENPDVAKKQALRALEREYGKEAVTSFSYSVAPTGEHVFEATVDDRKIRVAIAPK
jgi:hypothetical protein